MRKVLFANKEYYHIFNRGTDKRVIFPDSDSVSRFFRSIEEFNVLEPIGSIYENSFKLGNRVSKLTSGTKKSQKLVNFICYCLNLNHYHFILEQATEKGIEKFMHRIGVGFTKYFNQKYNRSGVLFQGPFKAVLIDSNEYLLHLSAYVNLNYLVHHLQLGNPVSKSSWEEYIINKNGFCEKDIILDQFKNRVEYRKFAEEAVLISQERKDMENLLLE